MFEEFDNVEELDKLIHDAHEELKKLSFDDQNRTKVLTEIKTLTELRSTIEENENKRLNNNAQNDIREQRLRIDDEKNQVELKRVKTERWKIVLYFLAGLGAPLGGYFLDPWLNSNKQLDRFGERLREMIAPKK